MKLCRDMGSSTITYHLMISFAMPFVEQLTSIHHFVPLIQISLLPALETSMFKVVNHSVKYLSLESVNGKSHWVDLMFKKIKKLMKFKNWFF